MAIAESEPIGVCIIGGIKLNAMENTASFNMGEIFLQAFDSQVKNNLINGQSYGDLHINNFGAFGSPVVDPDGIDTTMPMAMAPFGLDD
ncbi:MAG: hypothetical protein FH758_02030 [Firmicutes bacterium]|nr:hypothetical protein [Bacillota bacterium]